MSWEDGVRYAAEVVIAAAAAGIAVWRAVVGALDSKLEGMEGRLDGQLQSITSDVENIDRRLNRMSERVASNSENIAVLKDRWDRQGGVDCRGGQGD